MEHKYVIGQRVRLNRSPQVEAGFNYGTGWPDHIEKPAIYHKLNRVADQLRRVAREAERHSWKLDMALRRVRMAETANERLIAVAEIEALAEYDPFRTALIVDVTTDNRPFASREAQVAATNYQRDAAGERE